MLYHPNTRVSSGSTSGVFISTLAAALTNNCGWASTYQKKYHDGVYQLPQVNDTIYDDAALTTPFTPAGGGYWKIQGTHYSIKINSSTGNVDELIDCNKDFSGYTAFSLADTDYATSGASCSGLWDFTTRYHNGSGQYPAVNDTLYYLNSSDVMTALTGFNDRWFSGWGDYSPNGLGVYNFELDNVGVVTSIVFCHSPFF